MMTRFARLLIVAVVVVGMCFVATSAQAQGAAAAEQLFQDGIALMDRGDYDEACAKFDASMNAEPSGGTALNLGRCNEERGKLASAWASYLRAVTLFSASGDGEREQLATERAAKLEGRVSRLSIEVTSPAGIEVRRDGELVAEGAYGVAVPADAGPHEIEATAEGYESYKTTVDLGAAGDSQTVTIPALEKADPAAPEPGQAGLTAAGDEGASAMLIAGAVLTGVGGAALIGGGVLGGLVLSDASDAENDPALCPERQCTPEGRAAIDDAEAKSLGADILLIAGGVVAATGLVLIIVDVTSEPGASSTARVAPYVSYGGAGVVAVGTF